MADHLKAGERRRGASLFEFALSVVLSVLLFAGAVDFGRIFFHAVIIMNAAGVGASYGAHSYIAAGQYSEMRNRSLAEAVNLSDITATAGQQCQCPDGTVVACSAILTTTCAGYGVPRAYVRMRTQQTFRTIGPWPWIANSSNIDREAWMRVR